MQGLRLEPVGDAQLYTAGDGSPTPTKAYAVTIQVGWQSRLPPNPIPLVVYGAAPAGVDVLLGLDVLRHGKLTVDGPKGEYELLLPRTVESAAGWGLR